MADDIEKQIDVVDGTITEAQANEPEYDPIYRVYEGMRIPVSKHMGPLWKDRFKEAKSKRKHTSVSDRWDEAIQYYQNDQGGRSNKRHRLGELGSGKENEEKYATENVVFANVSALVPATYAKNPDVAMTSEDPADEKQTKLYERLVSTLFKRKITPGVNLRKKMKRLVTTTYLTNICYIELSYVRKEDASEQAIQELEQLSEELQKADCQSTIKEIEGKLQALEERISVLAPSGPRCRIVQPELVITDPNNEDPDPCNGDFLIVGEYIRTDYLRAVYGTKGEEKGEWMSVYKPTHVLSGDRDAQGHDDEINNFTLLSEGAEHSKYGYNTEEQFKRACYTLCWYVWDKTTRRVMLFNDSDWSWPIWVWDDPYRLTRFYNVFALSFYMDPVDQFGRSEIMYYLDQQDEINQINHERARMRNWAMSKVFVDTNVVKQPSDIDKFLTSDTAQLVHGLDLPEGKKIGDVIGVFPTPSTQLEQLFNIEPMFNAINRLSSVSPILQNAQFKTNTTNKAIESYESSTQMRLDEKIDEVEDLLADLAQALLEMCIQFMDESEVISLLGAQFVADAGGWQPPNDPQVFNTQYNIQIVGGSTLKPTAKVKKEQALFLGQTLGQFANAAPMVIIVMLNALKRAFADDITITDAEWNAIIESVQAQMQRGVSTGGANGGGSNSGGGDTGDNGGGNLQQVVQQAEQLISQLPPQAQQFLGQGIAKGVPMSQLVQRIVQVMQQGQQQ